MASKGYYSVSTLDPRHEVRRANSPHSCWGAEVKVHGYWISVNAPTCTGSIDPGDLYLVHQDRRGEPNHPVNTCMTCAVYYKLSEFEGDTHVYVELSPREMEDLHDDMVSVLAGLHQMKSPGRR